MKGSKANLIIRQGKEENYRPVLYIEPLSKTDRAFESDLKSALGKVQEKFPGVDVERMGDLWAVTVPEHYHNGHEAHFGQVAEKYLEYLQNGNMPEWEVPGIAQFATVTKDHVYGVDRFGTIRILNIADGSPVGRIANEAALEALVNDQTDRLYLISDSGLVQCLHEIGAEEPTHYRAAPTAEELPAGDEWHAEGLEVAGTVASGGHVRPGDRCRRYRNPRG